MTLREIAVVLDRYGVGVAIVRADDDASVPSPSATSWLVWPPAATLTGSGDVT